MGISISCKVWLNRKRQIAKYYPIIISVTPSGNVVNTSNLFLLCSAWRHENPGRLLSSRACHHWKPCVACMWGGHQCTCGLRGTKNWNEWNNRWKSVVVTFLNVPREALHPKNHVGLKWTRIHTQSRNGRGTTIDDGCFPASTTIVTHGHVELAYIQESQKFLESAVSLHQTWRRLLYCPPACLSRCQ